MEGGGERFGDVLRRRRLAAGLSQEELAERAGLSARGISDLERGARLTPQRATARLLARALGLEPGAAREFEAAARGVSGGPDAPTVSTASTLPAPLTPLIGREREVSEVGTLLRQGRRLVTVTGPGGVGKTSIALEVACSLGTPAVYPDGVYIVPLGPLADAALVPFTLAAVLGVPERAGQSLDVTLDRALREKRLLLVLDNCEHVIEEAARLAGTLLTAGEHLHILATSREPLGVGGETVYRVPPLASPTEDRVLPAQLEDYPATRLFLERAARRGGTPVGTSGGTGAMTQAQAQAVAHICRRVDGLPLAIELAAARVGALGPANLAARLEKSFQLLAGGNRTAAARHQTLRATVDWSHDLLSEWERKLFRRLAVFAGGFTLEAAEQVCGDGLDVATLLAQLVDKSLVVAEAVQSDGDGGSPANNMGETGDGGVRYQMLETLRAYARERLEESGEALEIAARHAGFYLAIEPALAGA